MLSSGRISCFKTLHKGFGRHHSTGTPGRLLADYLEAVKLGELQPDETQKECVQQLSSLYDLLPPYNAAVDHYNKTVEAYREKRNMLRARLLQDAHKKQQQQQQQQQHNHPGGYAFLGQLRRLLSLEDVNTPAPAQPEALTAAGRIELQLEDLIGPEPSAPSAPKGVYIYGSVGSGKTMVMDRFYNLVKQEKAVPHMRRVHFNTALLEVHSRLHQLDRTRKTEDAHPEVNLERGQHPGSAEHEAGGSHMQDPVAEKHKQAKLAKLAVRRFLRQRTRQTDKQISESLARSNASVFSKVAVSLIRGTGMQVEESSWEHTDTLTASILCFDEVNVNDPFTALALKGIFEALIDNGSIIVATSNRAPWELNNFGVHETIFDHFKSRLLEACIAVNVSCADFRRGHQGIDPLGTNYIFPMSQDSEAHFEQMWRSAVEAEASGPPTACVIPVLFGRTLQVDSAAGGVARFTFSELCDTAKGASDYYAIAEHFHTVFLEGVPAMSLQKRNLARRFITLLDELYNKRTRFVCTAAAPPEQLFAGTLDDQPIIDLEQLQFESAVEGGRLRMDVMAKGGVAPVFSPGGSSVTSAQLGGLEEQFAFARAVSRLYEMSRLT